MKDRILQGRKYIIDLVFLKDIYFLAMTVVTEYGGVSEKMKKSANDLMVSSRADHCKKCR